MFLNEFYDASLLFLSHHEIHSFDFGNVFARKLSVTAHHGNESIGMFAMKTADGVSALGIGFARDTARIDDADVGRFFFFGRQTTACSQAVAQRGRFGVVEFATQRHESRLFIGDDRRR